MKYFKDGDLKYKGDKINRTLGAFICVIHKDCAFQSDVETLPKLEKSDFTQF
jgi:hypothetical protein